jgi:hypothetical protein
MAEYDKDCLTLMAVEAHADRMFQYALSILNDVERINYFLAETGLEDVWPYLQDLPGHSAPRREEER